MAKEALKFSLFYRTVNFFTESALNFVLTFSTLAIILMLTPFLMLRWLVLLVIGSIQAQAYIAYGRRLISKGETEKVILDGAISRLLGCNQNGQRYMTAWVRQRKRRSIVSKLLELHSKAYPGERFTYL